MKNVLLSFFIVFVLSLLLLTTFTFAELSLDNDLKQEYNLGEKIVTSFSVKEFQGVNQDVIFKVNLDCSPYALNYFTKSIYLEDNNSISIIVDPLRISKAMLGSCKIKSFLTSFDKETFFSFESDEFLITDELQISFELEKSVFVPGEKIMTTIVVDDDTINENVNVMLFFESNDLNFNSDEEISFVLDATVSSGEHTLLLIAEDENGNKAEKELSFSVSPIPTLLEIILEKEIFLPGEEGKVTGVLFDQAGEQMSEENISFKLGDDVISTLIKSNNPVSFKIPSSLAPGDYDVLISYGKLIEKTQITVKEVKELEIVFQESFAYVKNIGNVDYDEDVEFNLVGENSRTIIKKIRLNPDETTIIDLSKEVSEGVYEVSSPETETVVEVELEDNRNVVKKTTQGFGSVTGAVIGKKGSISFAPFVFVGLLVALIFGFTFFRKKKKVKF